MRSVQPEKLKPCPFCGGEAVEYVTVIRGNTSECDGMLVKVGCCNCDILKETFVESTVPFETVLAALSESSQKWNRRAENA